MCFYFCQEGDVRGRRGTGATRTVGADTGLDALISIMPKGAVAATLEAETAPSASTLAMAAPAARATAA
jgi:hypothetical protein